MAAHLPPMGFNDQEEDMSGKIMPWKRQFIHQPKNYKFEYWERGADGSCELGPLP